MNIGYLKITWDKRRVIYIDELLPTPSTSTCPSRKVMFLVTLWVVRDTHTLVVSLGNIGVSPLQYIQRTKTPSRPPACSRTAEECSAFEYPTLTPSSFTQCTNLVVLQGVFYSMVPAQRHRHLGYHLMVLAFCRHFRPWSCGDQRVYTFKNHFCFVYNGLLNPTILHPYSPWGQPNSALRSEDIRHFASCNPRLRKKTPIRTHPDDLPLVRSPTYLAGLIRR
ncbi:hypothetical protein V8B97DRAFT_387379 [Scleroderma yunnanense]